MATALLIIVFLIAVAALISYVRSSKRTSNVKKDGLALFPLSPIWYLFLKAVFSNRKDVESQVELFNKICGINLLFDKERIFGVAFAGKLVLHIYKPEYIKIILSSNEVINKSFFYAFMHPWLGTGLLTSSKEKWKQRRKLLTPAFHFSILETFQPIFNKHSFTLIKKLKELKEESWVDIVPLMSLCTLDIIGESAMGVELKSQDIENSEYVQAVGKMERLLTKRGMYPWLNFDTIFYLTSTGKEFKRCVNIIHNFTRQVIRERKREFIKILAESKDENKEDIFFQKKERKPFLDLLLYHHLKEGDITEEDIREEVDTFMLAGHDTTATGVSWTLYCLGRYPEIQEKAYKELYEIFGDDRDRPITCGDLRELKYIECVIKESMRLYPPVPLIAREHQEEFQLGEVTIPKNALINIFVHSIHRDPEFFPNPETFNPERFYPENCKGRNPFVYIPFSAGPRNCIGQKFALMEEKVLVANILRHFRIYAMEPPDKVVKCVQLVLRSIKGLHLKFEPRFHDSPVSPSFGHK